MVGIPLPKNLINAPLDEVFNYLDNTVRQIHPQERLNLTLEFLAQMETNPKITDEQLNGIASYYRDLVFPESRRYQHTFGPTSGTFPFLMEGSIYRGWGPLYTLFRDRHDPARLIRHGADPAQVRGEFFSAFSSPAAFQRLKQLFDGNISYAHTSYDSAAFYQSIDKKLGPVSPKGFTLSLTNIIDCMAHAPCSASNRIKEIEALSGKILAKPKAPLVIFRTTETQLPHEFHRDEIPYDALAQLMLGGATKKERKETSYLSSDIGLGTLGKTRGLWHD